MNCKCQGCNSHSRSIGAMIGACGFFCKLGRGLKKVSNFVNDLGLLPPGVNVLVNAGAHALGADNADTTQTGGDNTARQFNQRVSNNRVGGIPTVF